MIKKFKLPSGIQDHLPSDCYARRQVEGKLVDCFKTYGYREIETPILERYELFDSGVAKIELSKLFKVTDVDGELLVLRPDITMPISRIVCTKLSQDCCKLYYVGKVFSALANEGKLREYTQADVEIIGAKGNGVDIELVMLAVKSLIAAGLDDFQVELGHVGFFKGLLDAYGVRDYDRETLMNCVESKNGIRLYDLSKDVDKRLVDTLSRLPMLFGGEEVLTAAEKMCLNEEMKNAVENLKTVYEGIRQLGYEKYVCFDLSNVGKMKYYSGIVVRGFNKDLGRVILSGGRYDRLCDSFGKRVPAVGFAIGIDYLVRALDNQNKLEIMPDREVIVGYAPDAMDRAEKYFKKLRKSKVNASLSFATTKERLKKAQAAVGAKRAVFVTKDSEEEL